MFQSFWKQTATQRELDHKQILVIAPHPDDESLGCGGVVAQVVEHQHDVTVVFVTHGEQGISGTSPETAKKIRLEECQEAIHCLGLKEEALVFLDRPDGKLHSHQTGLTEQVTSLLVESSFDAIYFPHRMDRHEDHEATGKAVIDAVRQERISIDLYEYPIWLRYCYPILETRPSIRGRLLNMALLPFSLYRLQKAGINVKVDISDVMSKKRFAIDCYRSQMTDDYSPGNPTLGTLCDGAFLSHLLEPYEYFRWTHSSQFWSNG